MIVKNGPGRGRGARVLLSVVLVVAVTAISGCGSRLDQQAIVEALAPTAGQSAAVASSSPVEHPSVEQSAPAPATAALGSVSAATLTTAGDAGVSSTHAGPVPVAGPAVVGGSKAAGVHNPAAALSKPPAAGAAAPAARAATRSTLTFGTIGSFSGLFAILGPWAKALGVWVAMQNDHGGLDGHPIKLIVGDDGGDPAAGLGLAKRMVEQDHITAFVGTAEIFGMDQYADYAKSKGLPWIGGDGIDPRWQSDPNLFPVMPPFINGVITALQHFVSEGATRLGVAYCLEVSKLCTLGSDTIMKSPVAKYVVADEQISLVAPSYTSQCLRMQAAKVEVIFLYLETTATQRFAQDCASQGYRPKYVSTALSASEDYPKADVLQGTSVPAEIVPPTETQLPVVAQFLAALAKYAPGVEPSGINAPGWADGLLLGRAGAHLSDNPTAAEFMENLWKMKGDTLGGYTAPLTFRKGQPALASSCTYLWGVKDHKWYAPQGAKLSC
ncbi:MAG TPA: ABC transporter substrate-binding protein [Pseudonocardiaceae bacterium]|nr:ABC transporter substrate-binding protein [Pseudonocardiaceae bacterium]